MNPSDSEISVHPEWEALHREVHVWTTVPEEWNVEKLQNECLLWLSDIERARYEQFQTPLLRHNHLAGQWLCRRVLSRYTDVAPAAWRLRISRHGKPRIIYPAPFKPLHFNLTHTQGLTAIALTRIGKVGIDAEFIERNVDIESISRRFFSKAEQVELTGAASEARPLRFFEIWVLKEAYLKGRGIGLSVDPSNVETHNAGGPVLQIGRWRQQLFHPSPQHVAALALRVRKSHIRGIEGASKSVHIPSPGAPGEGQGEGLFRSSGTKGPHPRPLPEHQERVHNVGDVSSDPQFVVRWRSSDEL